MKKTQSIRAEQDRAPASGPRVLHVVWTPGEEPWIENESDFALWEIAAVLSRLAEHVEQRIEDKDTEQEDEDE